MSIVGEQVLAFFHFHRVYAASIISYQDIVTELKMTIAMSINMAEKNNST